MYHSTGALLVACCVATVFSASISEPIKNSKFKNPTLITVDENSKFENPAIHSEKGRKLETEQEEQISNSKFKDPTVITADRNSKFENPAFFQVKARNLKQETQLTNSKFKNPTVITPDRNSKFENPAFFSQNGRKVNFKSENQNLENENDPIYDDEEFSNSKFLNPTFYDDEKTNSKFENSNAIDDKVNNTAFKESKLKRTILPFSLLDDNTESRKSQQRGILRFLRKQMHQKPLFPFRNNTFGNVVNNNHSLLRPFMAGYLNYLNRHGGFQINDNTFVYRTPHPEDDSILEELHKK